MAWVKRLARHWPPASLRARTKGVPVPGEAQHPDARRRDHPEMDVLGLVPCQYEQVPLAGEDLHALLDAIRATRADGGVLVGRFRAVGVTDPDRWFRTGSIVEADTNFRDLLTSDAFRRALPELRIPHPYPLSAPPRFEGGTLGALTLDGELAQVLYEGGAYERFTGTAAQAKAMAMAAVHDLVEDRYEDFWVYRSWRAWTDWFRDVAWDLTWFLVDRRRLEVTLLCTTDSD